MSPLSRAWWVAYWSHKDFEVNHWKAGQERTWTANKEAEAGDHALLYVKAPTSALVGIFQLTSDAWETDWASQFSHRHPWACEVRVECRFDRPLTIAEMRKDRELCRKWGLIRGNFQPPGGVPPRVPFDVLPMLAKHIPELQPYV